MGHARPWTVEENGRLQDLWATCTVNQIGECLHRNRNVVRARAKELGLPQKRRTPPVSIVLRNSPAPVPRMPVRTLPTRPRCEPCAGVGRLVEFRGRFNKEPAVTVIANGRPQPLPPRSDLVDAGDWRMEWSFQNGRRQLAVAILGYLRPNSGTVMRLLGPFLKQFSPRLYGKVWQLSGAEVDQWIRGIAPCTR